MSSLGFFTRHTCQTALVTFLLSIASLNACFYCRNWLRALYQWAIFICAMCLRMANDTCIVVAQEGRASITPLSIYHLYLPMKCKCIVTNLQIISIKVMKLPHWWLLEVWLLNMYQCFKKIKRIYMGHSMSNQQWICHYLSDFTEILETFGLIKNGQNSYFCLKPLN